jgi:plastocyanin
VINVGTGGGNTPTPSTGTPNTTQTALPSTTSGPTNTPVAGNAAVNIHNFVFTPQNLTINVGTTVTWTNNDPYAHTATSPGNFDSGNLNQGQTYSFTFNTPGTYNYFCALHPSMTGSIIVSNGGGGTPTSQPSGTVQTTGTPNTPTPGTQSPTPTRVPGLFTVDIRNYQYQPLTVTVRLGDTVRWTNFDADLHSVTDKALPPRFDSGPMAQNAQFSYTFTQPGTYEYVCEYHNPFMTAWVVVLPNDTGCGNGFTDVQPGSTFYNNIMCLTNAGIISGYNDCTFRPNADVTRGQLSKIIANAAGFNEPVSGQTFEDIPPNHTFYQFIERMAARGIIGGYGCGGPGEPCGAQNRPYFRANANATRGQISKIVANAANLNDDPGPQRFADVAPGSTFYNFIQRLSARGVMGGYACGGPGEPCGPTNMPYFRPGNNATRGQTSKITANTFFPSCTP